MTDLNQTRSDLELLADALTLPSEGADLCAICGAGPTGRCDPPDEYDGECPHGCSPER